MILLYLDLARYESTTAADIERRVHHRNICSVENIAVVAQIVDDNPEIYQFLD